MKKFKSRITINIILLIISINLNAQKEVPITILKTGHILIPVTVNDTLQGNFIFDTGGGIEIVSSAFFRKIESNSKRIGTFTCFKCDGERVDLKTYQIPKIKIGNLVKENIVVGVYPPLDDLNIDGLISSKFIESIPVTIDFKNQLFTIENKKSINRISKIGTSIPIFIQKHGRIGLDIFIDVKINDTISVLSEFDTGHGFYPAWINSYYKDFIKDDNQSASDITTDKLSLKEAENLKLLNPTIELKNDLIYEGLIGTQLFKTGRLSIDIQNERMVFRE